MTQTDPATIAFFPEPGAWGPTNNCVAIANVLAERGHRIVFVVDESFEGVLESSGVRGAADADGAARGERRPHGGPVGGVHPGHGAGVPQAHDRADRDGDEADLGGARCRRAILPRHDHGDLGRHRGPTSSCTDNVTGYPAIELAGCAMGAVRVGEPAGDARRRPAAGAVGAADRGPQRVASLRARSTTASTKELLAEHNDFRASVGVARVPARRVQHELAVAEPVPVPRGRRLRARRAAGRRRGTGCSSTVRTSEAPSTSTSRCPATARSSTCRSDRWGAWTSG